MIPPVDVATREEVDRWIREMEVPKLYQPMYRKALKGRSLRSAVNAQCQNCMGYETNVQDAIADCSARACPLWAVRPYRGRG